jgi:hypothetical protein
MGQNPHSVAPMEAVIGDEAPRSLLIGRGSVVAVDLAGWVDPVVRTGS